MSLKDQLTTDMKSAMKSGDKDRLKVVRLLLADIPLDRVTTSMTINSTAGILLALYIVVAEGQGVAPAACRCTQIK